MKTYSKTQLDRIGNTIIYLADKIPALNKTQLLKLLFFIEEFSVLHYHRPFLSLKFEVWKLGPVAKDIFIDLSSDGALLKKYVKIQCNCNNTTTIIPIKPFSDDEFSDNDIVLLDSIVKKFGKNTAQRLVKITHQKDGIWHKLAEENNLLADFETGSLTSTDIQIDLTALLDDCSKEFYSEQCEAQHFFNSLNN